MCVRPEPLLVLLLPASYYLLVCRIVGSRITCANNVELPSSNVCPFSRISLNIMKPSKSISLWMLWNIVDSWCEEIKFACVSSLPPRLCCRPKMFQTRPTFDQPSTTSFPVHVRKQLLTSLPLPCLLCAEVLDALVV